MIKISNYRKKHANLFCSITLFIICIAVFSLIIPSTTLDYIFNGHNEAYAQGNQTETAGLNNVLPNAPAVEDESSSSSNDDQPRQNEELDEQQQEEEENT